MASKTNRDIFQAIADPTRRAIIFMVAMQAMTPNAIAGHFDCTRQAVSKHIHFLTECSLLVPQQQGREIYYHINPDKMSELETWMEQFKSILNKKFNQLDNVLQQLKSKQP